MERTGSVYDVEAIKRAAASTAQSGLEPESDGAAIAEINRIIARLDDEIPRLRMALSALLRRMRARVVA